MGSTRPIVRVLHPIRQKARERSARTMKLRSKIILSSALRRADSDEKSRSQELSFPQTIIRR
jgi:hypothetical protein